MLGIKLYYRKIYYLLRATKVFKWEKAIFCGLIRIGDQRRSG